MKYRRFEDTPVWKDAARLYVALDEFAQLPVSRGPGDLRDQLLRAGLSISNNIAEGFDRGTTTELIQYLYQARGSAGEARSMLTIMQGIERFGAFKSQIADMRSRADAIGRQLWGWAEQLQNSEIAGRKHLTETSRGQYDRRKRARAFEAKLSAAVAEARAEREVKQAREITEAPGRDHTEHPKPRTGEVGGPDGNDE